MGKKLKYSPFLDHDVHTPITDEILEALEQLRLRYNGTWSQLCDDVGVQRRVMRKLRKRRYKTVSLRLLDRILTYGGSLSRVEDFPWYTTEELIETGLWDAAPDWRYQPHDENRHFMPAGDVQIWDAPEPGSEEE